MSETNPTNPIVTVNDGATSRSVELYSEEGLRLIAGLWVKVGAQYRIMYEPRWMGIPVIQFPSDIVAMQELIWKLQPDWIVECGIAHGGSLVFYSSLLELIGKGRVLGVDVEIRAHNRTAIEAHPMFKRIEMIEGSSVDPAVVSAVRQKVQGAGTVLVVLDSNHSRDHVAKELDFYADIVTPGSYLVAMDGAQAFVWDIPRGKREWKDDNPLIAIREFVAKRSDFSVDPHYTRMHITSNPEGFLRRAPQ